MMAVTNLISIQAWIKIMRKEGLTDIQIYAILKHKMGKLFLDSGLIKYTNDVE